MLTLWYIKHKFNDILGLLNKFNVNYREKIAL